MRLEDLGLIGNCQYAGLVAQNGALVWCCLPRFDSEPVFAALLDAERGGSFLVGPAGGESGVQHYIENTNVLVTSFCTEQGSFRVLDLAPRFLQHERSWRPTLLVRIVEPLAGSPRVVLRCEPILGWSRQAPRRVLGSNHVSFEGYGAELRLTSDVPPAYLAGQPFLLTEKHHLVLTWGAPVEEPLTPLCERLLSETVRYWQRWVKHCNIPPRYQSQVIRSALALKLHCYEDTGAIVAATTTSIPESPGSGRTWDYRYCWLRDAYYALEAFRLLGQFEERERFVQFLLGVAAGSSDLDLRPLYRVDGSSLLEERVLHDWPGFAGERPVRTGNQAAQHVQNDVFGEMVLALTPIFLDQRFQAERTAPVLELVQRLADKAIAAAGQPDASIWEYRIEWQPQTFTSLMCWAGAERMARIAALHAPGREAGYRTAAERIREQILERAWSSELAGFASSYGGHDLDASLLEMVSLRFLPGDDVRMRSAVDAIRHGLEDHGWLRRYGLDDGFGRPQVAFILCTFWLVEALAVLGRVEEARAVLERALGALTPLGLLGEDLDPRSGRLWGNFPQAYSHVGLIHAAFAASPRWSEAL